MNPQDAAHASPEMLAQRFDLLAADASRYALFLIDPSGRLMCWNRGAEKLFGYRTDEVVGQHFLCFFSPEDAGAGQPEYELKAARDAGHVEHRPVAGAQGRLPLLVQGHRHRAVQ